MRRLPRQWAERDATVVAPLLLNKLVTAGGRLGRVLEVEAYTADDPASHSFRGRTPRNTAMFGPAGTWYVYFIYGMHHCLNLVTGEQGDGQAVLIRTVRVEGIDLRSTTGPGRLCRTLGIDRSLDGCPAEVLDDGVPPPEQPLVTPRIGITRGVDMLRRWVCPSDTVPGTTTPAVTPCRP